MTDDQTLESLRVMPKTRRLVGDAGTTFDNFFASYPLCCPSRATLLTGQFAHNHKVLSNAPPNGGYGQLDHGNTLATWLQAAGYHTSHVGKYLNGYGEVVDPTTVPPGWSDWQGLVDPSSYALYGYTINDNGALVRYGDAPPDYQTDVLAGRAVEVIRERTDAGVPFFLSVAPLAPHAESAAGEIPPRPAPRHTGAFAAEPVPRPPSFDEADVSDKPADIRKLPRLTSAKRTRVDNLYRGRLGSLLAVDDLVERVVSELQDTDQLANTMVAFTSDNGFFLGEHRLSGKFYPYDEAVRVPLLLRGPGVPAARHADQWVTNVDLAPTILEATGTSPGRVQDGRSLLPLANDPALGRGRNLLLEGGPNFGGRTPYRALRTPRYLYAEHASGDVELYDLEVDRYQLRSLHADPRFRAVRDDLRARLQRLRVCAGSTCSQGT